MEPNEKGTFERLATTYRAHVSLDPSSTFPAEKGRYHVYASYACLVGASRVLITRALRGLERRGKRHDRRSENGRRGLELHERGARPDLRRAHPRRKFICARIRSTRVALPCPSCGIARRTRSSTTSRARSSACSTPRSTPSRCGPRVSRHRTSTPRSTKCSDAIYEPINNGVYAAGFATKQEPYEKAVTRLFAALTHWDGVLAETAVFDG